MTAADQPQPFTPGAGRPHLAALTEIRREIQSAMAHFEIRAWLFFRGGDCK